MTLAIRLGFVVRETELVDEIQMVGRLLTVLIAKLKRN